MNWLEKEYRRDARYFGNIAENFIRRAVSYQNEAKLWRGLSNERVAYWTARADFNQERAVWHATRAVRAAAKAREAGANLKEENDSAATIA